MYKLHVNLRQLHLVLTHFRPESPSQRRRAEVNHSPKAPKMFHASAPTKFRQATALALTLLLAALNAQAGVIVRGTQGITMTGADGST